jgi:hypothetical protein
MEKITAYKLTDGSIVEDEGTARDKQAHINMKAELKELIYNSDMPAAHEDIIERFMNSNLDKISQIVFNHINLR